MASAAAVALALGGLVGGVFAEQSASRAAAVDPRALVEGALAGSAGSTGTTAAALARLEAEARTDASDPAVLVQLGFAYQLRWRETADPSYLPRSEVALRRALRARPDEPNAVLGLGSLALIRHEFEDALAHGKRARLLLPGSGRPHGVIGDALVELGRYEEAFAAFQRMVTLRPNLASYARVAYARELTGDLVGALAAMRLARDAAGGQPEAMSFALVEIAKLELTLGRRGAALRHARLALRVLPGYPAARLAVARIDAARGRLGAAIGQARRASEAIPSSEAVMLYSDLLGRAGKSGEARRQRAALAVIDRLLETSGVGVDLESAVHRADLRIRPGATVRLARRARAARPSIYGDDALAWALARAGRCREALPFAQRSLRLGTRDALLYFHRGYAEGCAGDEAAMHEWYERALALNPEFSVRWAPVARAALGR